MNGMSLKGQVHVAEGLALRSSKSSPNSLTASSPPPPPTAEFLDELLMETSRKLSDAAAAAPGGLSHSGVNRDRSDDPPGISGAEMWAVVMGAYLRNRRMRDAPTAMICEMLQTCARCDVRFPEGYMAALEEELEERRRFHIGAPEEGLLAVKTGFPQSCSLAELRAGVLLPLARLRQGLRNSGPYTAALADWADHHSFDGLDERTASDLLSLFADRPTWATAPEFRRVGIIFWRVDRSGAKLREDVGGSPGL